MSPILEHDISVYGLCIIYIYVCVWVGGGWGGLGGGGSIKVLFSLGLLDMS